MRTLAREISIILTIAIALFLAQHFIFPDYDIMGSCMEPNFQNGQRVVVNKLAYSFHEPERGDVIILRPPYNPEATPFIKRIIALPGDTIEIKTGSVYINGTPLQESYIKEPPTYTLKQKKIPENEYFVLGDNRNNANDSHKGWTLPYQNIIGKAWLTFWPPSEWGLISHYPLQEQLVGSANK